MDNHTLLKLKHNKEEGKNDNIEKMDVDFTYHNQYSRKDDSVIEKMDKMDIDSVVSMQMNDYSEISVKSSTVSVISFIIIIILEKGNKNKI